MIFMVKNQCKQNKIKEVIKCFMRLLCSRKENKQKKISLNRQTKRYSLIQILDLRNL